MGTLSALADFSDDAGQRLREAREALGLSQFDAAVKLGVTDKTLGLWERGERRPTRKNDHGEPIWDQIERVYGVSRRYILGEREQDQLDRIETMLKAIMLHLGIAQPEAGAPPTSGGRPKLPSQRSTRRDTAKPRSRRAAS